MIKKISISLKSLGFKKTIIVGGPHPTTSYTEVLKDQNIDICVLGEGEATLAEIIKKLIDNGKKRLSYNDIININGIAISEDNPYHSRPSSHGLTSSSEMPMHK